MKIARDNQVVALHNLQSNGARLRVSDGGGLGESQGSRAPGGRHARNGEAALGRRKRLMMDGNGCWHDNVAVKRVWRSIKREEVCLKEYESADHARAPSTSQEIMSSLAWSRRLVVVNLDETTNPSARDGHLFTTAQVAQGCEPQQQNTQTTALGSQVPDRTAIGTRRTGRWPHCSRGAAGEPPHATDALGQLLPSTLNSFVYYPPRYHVLCHALLRTDKQLLNFLLYWNRGSVIRPRGR
ncbi:hypothetical protein [Burkholderia ubonensis]|uniref:hypothetical protein n=1 Tax=Burkholderia ubonensis TaxID=101571 RepID=UPI000A9F7066|nr:hypothetical protein [Burkholderia ubonensis]